MAWIKTVFPPIKNKKVAAFILAAFIIFFVFFKFLPYVNFNLDPGLDPSWKLALNWGSQLHIPWSNNSLVFTYGPLYFLSEDVLPDFHTTAFLVAVSIFINVAVLITNLAFLFFLLKITMRRNLSSLIVALSFVILALSKQQYINVQFLTVLALLPIFFGEEVNLPRRLLSWFIIMFFLSTLAFSKFTFMVLAIFFLMVLLILCVYKKYYWDLLLLPGIFVSIFIFSWVVLAGQKLANLLGFLSSSFIVSKSYTEAMALGFSNIRIVIVFLLTIVFATFLLSLIISHRKTFVRMLTFLLPSVILFIIFKNSFVRADNYHLNQFFAIFPLFCLLVLILLLYPDPDEKDISIQKQRVTFLNGLVILGFSLIIIIMSKPSLKVQNPIEILKSISHQSQSDSAIRRSALREAYGLDPVFLEHISKTETIDVLPWDISLLYAYQLNWTPRPVLQTYIDYSPELDNMNATFFIGENAPEQILISYVFLDNRYLPYDMPNTFRVLLEKYDFITISEDGKFALLNRKSGQAPQHELKLISSGEYSLGQDIAIPKIDGEKVFMHVEINPTILGKLANFVFKTPSITLKIETKEGTRYHPFIRVLGSNDLFVSRYIKDIHELKALFDGDISQDIDAVCFFTDTLFFKDHYQLSFFSSVDSTSKFE